MSNKIFRFLIILAVTIICITPAFALGLYNTKADTTAQSVGNSANNDYVFFIIDNEQAPLAAIPTELSTRYIPWFTLTVIVFIAIFIYISWYLNIRSNLWELSGKLPPAKRYALKRSMGFFHPVRSYRMCKEAEQDVVSIYSDIEFSCHF